MMPAPAVHARKPAVAAEFVFPWRPRKSPWFPRVFAIAAVGGGMALLISTVRVEVTAPEKLAPRKGSVIFLGDDAESRALRLRAREGGPFPSRFEPLDWPGLAETERRVMEAAQFRLPPYVPELRDLPPGISAAEIELAPAGKAFFPERKVAAAAPVSAAAVRLAPVLTPLSAAAQEALPEALPPFAPAVDSTLASPSWRWLVRLDAHGGVAEAVSLEKGGEPGAAEIERWLRAVRFRSAPGATRWLAVGVDFTNQPVTSR